MKDYTTIAMESLMQESTLQREVVIRQMIAESKFILRSLENGEICGLQEADLSDAKKKIMNTLKEFINMVNQKFKEKQARFYENYAPWVEKNEDRIKKAAAQGSLTLAPYWKGNAKSDINVLKTLAGDAFKTPFEDGDVSFAKKVLTSVNKVEDLQDTGEVSRKLANRFRFGIEESDNSKIKKETIKEADLVSKIDQMLAYVKSYKEIVSSLNSVSNTWKSNADAFQKAVSESLSVLTKDRFLLIESSALRSTDLCLLEGFNELPELLLEADGDGSGDTKKENESLTNVQDNTDKKEGSSGEGTSKAKKGSDGRYQLVDKFVRLAYSAYMTACEERFVVYIKCMSEVLGESPKSNNDKKKEEKTS